MKLGAPVTLTGTADGHVAEPLPLVSTRRDDPASFPEDLLQELIAGCPNVLPVREYLPGVSTLFSLGREIPVDIGGTPGYIDNLLVADDGHLVIVETKLYRNREAIRDVVTQTLQYGMAIGGMRVPQLEAAIRRGEGSAMRAGESLVDCVTRLSSSPGSSAQLADDWEEALERNLRRGELLLLVASDEIHVGVERVTTWISQQGGSTPYKFGLVELRFYSLGDRRLVVPRTLLKTREISRHVVVVDILPTAEVSVVATVTDEIQNVAGARLRESRQVKPAGVLLTKSSYLQSLAPDLRAAATQVIEALEGLGFEALGTPSTLKMGFTDDDGEFHSIVSFDWTGAWASILKRDRERLGEQEAIAFKQGMNRFGSFYRPDKLDQAEGGGTAAKYHQLGPKAGEFAAFLDEYRTRLLDLLRAE